jgi:transglutaminase-like putative cysteine protease
VGSRALAARAMKLQVSHRTTYVYRAPVAQSHHTVHLKPRDLPGQKLLNHSLLIEPAPVSRTDIIDSFGNAAQLLRIDDAHTEFSVHARSTVEMTLAPLPDLDQGAAWADVANGCLDPGRCGVEIQQFVCSSRHAPISRDIRDFALAAFQPGRPVLAGAMDLTRRIFSDFVFDPQATDVSTPIARVLATRRGVCQDFAHLAIATVRSVGIPARYVSGYLMTQPPPGQIKLKGADASHAWLSVWSPETGWVDFDPTNGILPSGEHVTVAYGRDYDDISPISGIILGGGEQTMSVAVDVEPVV